MWMRGLLLFNSLWLWIEGLFGTNPLWMWFKGVLAPISGPTPVVTCPESQSVEEVPLSDCTEDVERPRDTGLSDLPDEMVVLILAKLSLHELARVSRTCSTFQAVCRRQVDQEQQTRCDLAVGCLGRERLISLSLLIDRFLKGEPLSPKVAEQGKDADWVLAGRVVFKGRLYLEYKVGDLEARVSLVGFGALIFRLPTLKGILLQLHITRHNPDSFNMNLTTIGNQKVAIDPMEGEAILEALRLFPSLGCRVV